MAFDVNSIIPFGVTGRITSVQGLAAEVGGFSVPMGAICEIGSGSKRLRGEVVGFRDDKCVVFPYGDLAGVRRGDSVRLAQTRPTVQTGPGLLGRVLDGWGNFLDHQPRPELSQHPRPLVGEPVPALSRPPIKEPLTTGIRAIDSMLTCGRGQRLGVFAGSGVGKSTLLGQIARGSSADVNVVVLVGERGREVREFLENDLGREGLERSVVIVATSEEPALMRMRAAHLGTTIAESFRDAGQDTLLMMDSVTRYALAQREVGLAAGEPPATRGYPPSVFAKLPRLLERSGRTEAGSITGIYTVLVDGDDTNEPISDAVRGILDGHIVLSRSLAERGHWPAIDILGSVSRVMPSVTDAEHRADALRFRQLWAAYRDNEDLISIGAYQIGANADVDEAIARRPLMTQLLQQRPDEAAGDVRTQLREVLNASVAPPPQPTGDRRREQPVAADNALGQQVSL